MAALQFPANPTLGQFVPANPGTSGVTQYQWDGTKWNAVLSTVSLGTANQGVYNSYDWPTADGEFGQQLTTNGSGTLSWAEPALPRLEILSLLEPIDGVSQAYTLVLAGSTAPFTPIPSNNIIVFLGGVPQIPVAAYSVSGNTITFTEAPMMGSTFYAVSNVTA